MGNRIPLFYAVTALYWFSTYTYVPLLSPYVVAIGGSLSMAGMVVGSYGFSQMLVRVPIGVWSDKIRTRKPFVIAGGAIGMLSSLGFAVTHSVLWALTFRLLAGIAAGCWVVFTVLYASYHQPDEAPKAMGILSFYTSIGQLAASTLGGVMAERYGWHAAFWLGAAGGLAATLLACFIVDKPPARDQAGIRVGDMLTVGRDRIVLGVSFLAVLAQVVTFTTMFGFTPEQATRLGANKADLSWLTLAATLPNAIASYFSGSLFSRWMGERNVVASGFAIAALFTAAIPLCHALPLLYVTQAVNGFGQGLCMPVLMGLAIRHIEAGRRATAMGFYQAIYAVGMFGGPAVVGWLGDHAGLSRGFLAVAATSVIACALTFALAPSRASASQVITRSS
ncbi:MFS transporter [Alicyclobacillus acidocaldarius]|uniref:Major facilitator superfamily MFS_1 n=1 Tax=Alicyclobacillus acidocaldarius (strain Tc-4-1) TaxID=1048834 RepID=F8IHK6_ALIAT|nr:MFS transporter [Alicyclobacillus acidocaldarius]AEJ44479.1 major facilitator superfamily MFS_1 [Alicyclobacillus acidocaldarius subsp. acidocaldarius Tc-4-1]